MGRTSWVIVCIIGAAVMAAVSCVAAFFGGCPATLELASGNNVPMKCHWTFVADSFIGIIGVAVALMAATCKDQSGRRAAAVGFIATAIVAACMPAPFGIGLCADSAMHCHGTALIVWALCAVAAVIGVVQVVKSRPAADVPRHRL